MKITLNPDKETVAVIKEGLKQRGGYCPCRLEKTEDNKCMCREFREQIPNSRATAIACCIISQNKIKTRKGKSEWKSN